MFSVDAAAALIGSVQTSPDIVLAGAAANQLRRAVGIAADADQPGDAVSPGTAPRDRGLGAHRVLRVGGLGRGRHARAAARPVARLLRLIGTFITENRPAHSSISEGRPENGPACLATVPRLFEDRFLRPRVSTAAAMSTGVPAPRPASGTSPSPAPGSRWYTLLSQRLVEPLRDTDAAADALALELQLPRPTPEEQPRVAKRAEDHRGKCYLASLRLATLVLRASRHRPARGLRRHTSDAHLLIGDLAYEQGFLADKAEESYRMAMLLFEACGEHTIVGRLLAAIARTLFDRDRTAEGLNYQHAAVARVHDAALQDKLLWILNSGNQP